MANTEWAFPFADNGGDRVYSDSDFAKFFSAWFVNGVFVNVGGGLQIVDSSAGGMRITLKSGAANINGRVYYLNSDTDFTVPVASSTQDRTDSIVLRLDLSERTMITIYKQSDISLVRNDTNYEIQLAKISVPKNINEITQSMITDMRTNSNVCGLASPNDPINVDTFISQFEAEFNEQLNTNNTDFINWFTNLQNQLNSNQASNLQNQINSLTTNVEKKSDDSSVVHNSGDEDVNGNKNFEDTLTVNEVVTKSSSTTLTIGGMTLSFLETSLGVNVSVSGTYQGSSDGVWKSAGNIPSNITKPNQNIYLQTTAPGGVGGVTVRSGFTLKLLLGTDGTIQSKYISLRENDTKGYTSTISTEMSGNWIK